MVNKRKEQKLASIARIYLHSISIQFSNSSITKSQKIELFKSSVELAYQSLDVPLKKIINNDFFYQEYPGWWKLLYSKSSYQKLRLLAINRFLEVFYEL